MPTGEKIAYQKPKISVLSEEQVLAAFQMTAAQISAAGCWWMPCTGSACSGPGNPGQ
jgi:hypothetical protein